MPRGMVGQARAALEKRGLDAVGDLKRQIAVVHIAQLRKIGDIYGPYWKAIGHVYVSGLRIPGYTAALLRLVELTTGRPGQFEIVPVASAWRTTCLPSATLRADGFAAL